MSVTVTSPRLAAGRAVTVTRAAGRGGEQGVAEQVGEHLGDPVRIDVHGQRLVGVDGQRDVRVVELRGESGGRAAGEVGQVRVDRMQVETLLLLRGTGWTGRRRAGAAGVVPR